MVVKPIMEQPIVYTNHSNSVTYTICSIFLMGLWWFCCMEFNVAYKSKLSALFVKHEKSICNISHFLENGYDLIINDEDSFMFDEILQYVNVTVE